MDKHKIEQTVEFYTRYLEFVKTIDDNMHHAAVMYATVHSDKKKQEQCQ